MPGSHHPTPHFTSSLPEALLHKAAVGIILPRLLNKKSWFPGGAQCAVGLLSCRRGKVVGVSIQSRKSFLFSCLWCHNVSVRVSVRHAHPYSWSGTTKLWAELNTLVCVLFSCFQAIGFPCENGVVNIKQWRTIQKYIKSIP